MVELLSSEKDKFDDYVRRAVNGDKAAMNRLLLLHHDRLLRRIDRGLPMDVERAHGPEDVLQDVFADAFRQIQNLKVLNAAGFRGWLDAIARNRVINLIKEERALKRCGGVGHVDGTAADAVMAFLSRDTASPREKALNTELLSVMRAAFERLPADHRQVLTLRFSQGLEYEEIAAQMNRKQGAVRMLALRALRHLKSLLPGSDWQ